MFRPAMFRSVLGAHAPPCMREHGVFKCIIGTALLVAAQAAGAATPRGIVTILEGRATAIRALSQFDAAEAMRLLGDDLVPGFRA
jgi:hypothetical protein